jgi:glucokinase
LDVGGTKIACGLFLEGGKVLFQKTVATSQESAEASVGQLVSLVNEAVSQSPVEVVAGAVGVVIPGWVDSNSRTVWAPNISGWDHLPLERRLAEQIPLPIILDSDRSGCVKGEAWLGEARGLNDVVFLAVGTGIGAGIMAGGQILHGHDDLAGSVGWMALNPRFQDLYVQMGCFEAEASGNSVGRKGAAVLGNGVSASGTSLTARDITEAASFGERQAKRILDEAVVYLGMGIANLVSILNPEMVVLGGGLFRGGTYLLDRVRQEFVRWAQPFAAQRVRVELSALGDRAALIGAARIAFDNI